MHSTIDVLFSPADFCALSNRDLSSTVCVVFDVLRATSVFVVALANGAQGIIPVASIEEALEQKRRRSNVLLGGERNGLRIGPDLTGGVGFDLGNSPREYVRERVTGKFIVSTTTNGTRALRACAGAKNILASSFLNSSATQGWIVNQNPRHLLILCAGTGDDVALEDMLAAGALCDSLASLLPLGECGDAFEISRRAYRQSASDLPAAVRSSRNARRLLANPDLRDDVEICLSRDSCHLVPILEEDGIIRKASETELSHHHSSHDVVS